MPCGLPYMHMLYAINLGSKQSGYVAVGTMCVYVCMYALQRPPMYLHNLTNLVPRLSDPSICNLKVGIETFPS